WLALCAPIHSSQSKAPSIVQRTMYGRAWHIAHVELGAGGNHSRFGPGCVRCGTNPAFVCASTIACARILAVPTRNRCTIYPNAHKRKDGNDNQMAKPATIGGISNGSR